MTFIEKIKALQNINVLDSLELKNSVTFIFCSTSIIISLSSFLKLLQLKNDTTQVPFYEFLQLNNFIKAATFH